MKILSYFFKGYLEVGGHLENKMKRLHSDIMREGVKILVSIEVLDKTKNDDVYRVRSFLRELSREFQERLNRERKAEREARGISLVDPSPSHKEPSEFSIMCEEHFENERKAGRMF